MTMSLAETERGRKGLDVSTMRAKFRHLGELNGLGSVTNCDFTVVEVIEDWWIYVSRTVSTVPI